jgi:hypothetical protein
VPATQTALASPLSSRFKARRLTLLAPILLLAVGGALLGARARVPDNQIAPGVHIGNLDLGGKSLDAARAALEQWSAECQKTSVTLRFAADTGVTRVWKTSAQYLGLGIDVPATLDAAGKAGRSDVVSQISNLVHGVQNIAVAPIPAIDNNHLRPVLKQIGITVLRKPVDARIILLKGGGFGTRHDRPGLAMDVDASQQAVTRAWINALGSAPSAATPTAAPVTPSAAPPVADANAHQKPDTEDREKGNRAAIWVKKEETADATGANAQPLDNRQPTTENRQPATPLSAIDVELTAHATRAEIAFADIAQIDGELGTKTTTYATGDRGDNIHLAASHINGTLLKPGEIFSYNKIVGPREARVGFKDAPVIINGELKPGIGGGICQVSSTLYNAVLLSGLKIVQRSHHAFPVHYLPAGRDATVVDGDIDFQFQNSTDTPIYVVGRARGGELTFSIYGKKVPGREIVMEKGRDIIHDTPTVIEHDSSLRAGYRDVKRRGYPDRRVTWYRIVRQNGQEISREPITTHYSAVDEIVVVGTRASAPRRKPTSRPTPRPATPTAAPATVAPPTPPPASGGQQ